MNINEIKIGTRYRKDLGDLTSLVDSIKDIGLLHPILINENKGLICGHRRLEALKQSGLKILQENIHYRIVDIKDLIKSELHENTIRKDFLPTEKVAIYDAMESYETTGKKLPMSESDRGVRRQRASELLDISTDTLSKAKQVVESGDVDLIEDMDSGKESINSAYNKLKGKTFTKATTTPKDIPKSGTREWSDYSINIDSGCRHNCKYCYARYDAINRYNSVKNEKEWENPKRLKGFTDKCKKQDGRGMFPTTHDITPENVDDCIDYLKRQLKEGNEILITSKPHLDCIKKICKELKEYKKQIMFRFTIGSYSNKILKFWEPNAPSFEERLESLKYAKDNEFETSVSCEPILDGTIPIVIGKCIDYVTQTIWLGKMNEIESRINMTKWAEDDFPYMKMIDTTTKLEFAKWLYSIYKDTPKIRWKESYKKLLGLAEQEKVE